jgi:hypothetical protein
MISFKLIFISVTVINVSFFNDFLGDFLLFINRQFILGEILKHLSNVCFTDELKLKDYRLTIDTDNIHIITLSLSQS